MQIENKIFMVCGIEGHCIGYLSAANRTFVALELPNELPFAVCEMMPDDTLTVFGEFKYRSDAFEILTQRVLRILKR